MWEWKHDLRVAFVVLEANAEHVRIAYLSHGASHRVGDVRAFDPIALPEGDHRRIA